MHALALLVALNLAAPPVRAPTPAAPPAATTIDGTAAFERLKKLEGSWKTDAKDGPVQYVALRIIGNGSSVLETTTAADRTSVTSVTIYAFEGTELLASNYGSGGTSHLKLKDADPAALRFDGAAKDARVAGITFVLKDSKLKLELTTREGGREVKKALDLLREYVDTLK